MPKGRVVSFLLSSVMASSLLLGGCGHSEDEWQSKLKELEAANNKLTQVKGEKRKCDDDLAKATDDIANLRGDLAKASGQAGDLSKTAEEQRLLIERLKQEKAKLDEIRARFELLKKKLDSLTSLGLNVVIRSNRMVIQLPGDLLFASGKTDLKPEGLKMLGAVADVISKDAGLASRTYQVAGHTDNKPFNNTALKDNWGLSLMRAREVVVFLTSPRDGKEPGGGLNPKFWAAVGYADNDPLVPNTSPENMQKNRRVELVVMPAVEEMMDLRTLTGGK